MTSDADIRVEGLRSRRHTSPTDQILILALVVAGALLGITSGAEPTGWLPADVIWNAGAAGVVVWLASYGRRWSWIAAAALAGTASSELLLVMIGALTLAGITWVALKLRRRRVFGSLAAVPVVGIAFHLPHDRFHGLATLVAIVVVLPLIASGLHSAPSRVRRAAARWSVVGGVVILGCAVLVGIAAMRVRSHVGIAIERVQEAADAIRDEDDLAARELFALAVEEFEAADDLSNKFWVVPGRAVPILGQHTEALQVLATTGAVGATEAQEVLAVLDRDALRVNEGRVDLDAIVELGPPVADLAAALTQAEIDVAGVDSPWLAFPVSDRLADLRTELADAVEVSQQITDSVGLAPNLLGAERPRSFLILFTTPAEMRGSGGFVGNWVELTASDGQLEVSVAGRNEELNSVLRDKGVNLTGPPEYLSRYGVFRPEEFFQDVTLSPDFPTVAQVSAELYERATGRPVDVVAMADPRAMAALLELTGAITVTGQEMTAGNIEEFLLVGQYSAFSGEEARVQFLEELSVAAFGALLSAQVPDPWELRDILAPVVAQDRLLLWSSVPGEQRRLARLGLAGGFPGVGTGDQLAVIGQNSGQNKIDVFLRREVVYDVQLDPATGQVDATISVTLHNDAPAEGLVDAILANNDQGLPQGTNRHLLSVYSPHNIIDSTWNGEPIAMQSGSEFDLRVYSQFFQLAPGESGTLVLSVSGSVELAPDLYQVSLVAQPTVNPDKVTVQVRVADGYWVDGPGEEFGGVAAMGLIADQDRTAEFPLGES